MRPFVEITTFGIFKASAAAALGWFVGKGIYALAVEITIRACEKMSRWF